MKKKVIIISSLIVLLALLSYISVVLVSNRGKSNSELNNYAIADTAAVDRIVITMSNGLSIDLRRADNIWTTKDGQCIQQEPIFNMLHTFKNIAIKAYLPENAIANIKNNLSINHRKVQIFQHGKWVKTWYVGNSTADHYGTYALLETVENGKSDDPNVLEMKGLKGTIEPRFFADYRQWACTQIFANPIETINQIEIKNYLNPLKSFKISKEGKGVYKLYLDGKLFADYNPVKLDEYLHRFENVHFNMPNYELNKEQVDSVRHSQPFYKLTLTDAKNNIQTITTFRIKLDEPDFDIFGDTISYNMADMWALLDNGELVKVQYFVFDKLAVDHSFFKNPDE